MINVVFERTRDNLEKICGQLKSFGESIHSVRRHDNIWMAIGENSIKLEYLLIESSKILATDCEGIKENILKEDNFNIREYIHQFREHSRLYFNNLKDIGSEIRKSKKIEIYDIKYIVIYRDILWSISAIEVDLSKIAYTNSAFDSVLRGLRYANSYIDSIVKVESTDKLYVEGSGGMIKMKEPKIFIIYGRDLVSLDKLKLALHAIGTKPITFDDLPKPGAVTVIEILERHIPQFDIIIALLTPDDEGRLIGENDLERRARQNVLIEAGCAIISHRQKSLLISIGEIIIPSDFEGIHRVESKEWSDATSLKVAKKIKEMGDVMGFNIDLSKLIR